MALPGKVDLCVPAFDHMTFEEDDFLLALPEEEVTQHILDVEEEVTVQSPAEALWEDIERRLDINLQQPSRVVLTSNSAKQVRVRNWWSC